MTREHDDVQSLFDELRRGDQEAFAALFSRYRERLRRVVEFRMDARLRGRVSASDVLQDAYIDALKRWPHLRDDPDVPFFIWARTVTLQRVVEVHRQHLGAQARDAARELARGGIEASTEKMAELVGNLTSPSQAAQRGEAKAALRAALDQLDPIDREVLALRHFEELSNHEAAAALGIQTAAASKRYVRALERLKDALEPGPDGEKGNR